jgi:hypothetical protein
LPRHGSGGERKSLNSDAHVILATNTEIQAYGQTAFVYSTHVYEIEQAGERSSNAAA